MVKTAAVFGLAAALPALPLAALPCNDAGPEAMACCQSKAAECNQPGRTDDCCRKVPVERGAAAGPSQVTVGKLSWKSFISFGTLGPVGTASAAPVISQIVRPTPPVAWVDVAPPPLSVLRI